MKKALVLAGILILACSNLCLAKVVHQYFPDGKLKSVQIYDEKGRIVGPYKIYWPNGKLRVKIIYKHGRPLTAHKWSEKGVRID